VSTLVSTHPGGTPALIPRDYPTMDWVGILMYVSACGWHRGRMTMIGGTGSRPGGTWTGGTVVTGGVAVALVTMGYLHVTGAAAVDPLDRTISDHVGVPGGYGLLAVAAFSPDTPAGVVANIHRVAGARVFASLPPDGWMVASRARPADGWRAHAPRLTWVAGATSVLSAVFLLSHLPIVIGTSSGFPLLGGVERVLYAAVMLVLLVTARATRLAVPRGSDRSATALGTCAEQPADIGRVA